MSENHWSFVEWMRRRKSLSFGSSLIFVSFELEFENFILLEFDLRGCWFYLEEWWYLDSVQSIYLQSYPPCAPWSALVARCHPSSSRCYVEQWTIPTTWHNYQLISAVVAWFFSRNEWMLIVFVELECIVRRGVCLCVSNTRLSSRTWPRSRPDLCAPWPIECWQRNCARTSPNVSVRVFERSPRRAVPWKRRRSGRLKRRCLQTNEKEKHRWEHWWILSDESLSIVETNKRRSLWRSTSNHRRFLPRPRPAFFNQKLLSNNLYADSSLLNRCLTFEFDRLSRLVSISWLDRSPWALLVSGKSYLGHNTSTERYLRNLQETYRSTFAPAQFLHRSPIVVNEMINNHVESSIDMCPVFTL